MSELMDAQRAVDIVTLANELARYKEVEAVGGVAYLASLTEGLPRRPVIEEYIRIVKDKSLLRQLMAICSAAIARAADQSETALEVLGAAEAQLLEVSEKGICAGLAAAGPDCRATRSARSTTSTSRAARSRGWPRISSSWTG